MPHLKTTETVVARSAIDKDILRDEGVHPEVEGYGKVVLVRIVRVEKYADGDVGRRLETVSEKEEILAEIDADQVATLGRSLFLAQAESLRPVISERAHLQSQLGN